MTYQVLARKWRPKRFADLIGQSNVSKALTYALTENRLHHAYLFTGTRGVGKTTLARLLAKSLNCEKGVQAEPCGSCSACIEIQEGCFPDVLEVDAASRTRIEDTKELLDNAIYAPLRGRYKIYLIDEVHMLSGHSFNALLKTLEEPPEHVKFIFATTEPERIPVTILSRCLHFNLRPILKEELEKQLELILRTENIPFEPTAVPLLAKAGRGSMRDCLSLLEQAIAIGQGKLQTLEAAQMLGLQAHAFITPLIQAICTNNITALFELSNQLACVGADFEKVLESLLDSFQALNMMQLVPNAKAHVQNLHEVDEAILNLHSQLTPEQTQLYYQIALTGKKDLALMPDSRRAFDMVLLRMMCFRLVPSKSEAMQHSAPQTQVVAPKSATAIAPAYGAPAAPLMQKPSVKEPVAQAKVMPSPSLSMPAMLPVRTPEPLSQEPPNWRALITQLPLTGLMKLLAQHCVIQKWALPQIELVLEASQQPFLNADREKELSEVLSTHLKQPIRVSILLEGKQAPVIQSLSPAQELKVEHQDKRAKIESDLEQNDTVKTLIEVFDAKLMNLTITDSK